MDFGKILKYLRQTKKITQNELAHALDVSRSAISLYELGLREPDLKFLQRVCSYFDVSMDYLFNEDQTNHENIPKPYSNKNHSLVMVPIVGRVPAGTPTIPFEDIEDYLPVPGSFVREDETVFALKIKGDSMIDLGINNGDIVLVKKQETAQNGQTVIARIDGEEVTCKRFYNIDNRKVTLEPANSKYRALEPDHVEIVGVVFKVIKDVF
ncbi:transcriptional repressor LexA [Dehalobacter sp. DCM]|uniref:transcriptional repressor LexA n=1 Tax=Dehalobacter sp. DCM TaxID=2907827 RepID=UPI00308201FF|nr:transcriptional repressor LexA [Dehalobacter sp. DCM]